MLVPTAISYPSRAQSDLFIESFDCYLELMGLADDTVPLLLRPRSPQAVPVKVPHLTPSRPATWVTMPPFTSEETPPCKSKSHPVLVEAVA